MSLNGRKPLILSSHTAKLGGVSHYGSGGTNFLICQVKLQDQVIKRSRNFMRGMPS